MINPSKRLTVTAVKTADSPIMTAFFNELPGLIVQGNSEEDLRTKLTSLFESYMKNLESLKANLDIQTKSFA